MSSPSIIYCFSAVYWRRPAWRNRSTLFWSLLVVEVYIMNYVSHRWWARNDNSPSCSFPAPDGFSDDLITLRVVMEKLTVYYSWLIQNRALLRFGVCVCVEAVLSIMCGWVKANSQRSEHLLSEQNHSRLPWALGKESTGHIIRKQHRQANLLLSVNSWKSRLTTLKHYKPTVNFGFGLWLKLGKETEDTEQEH